MIANQFTNKRLFILWLAELEFICYNSKIISSVKDQKSAKNVIPSQAEIKW